MTIMDNPDVSPPDRDQLVLEEQAPVLSNIRLFLFATGQLTLWAAHVGQSAAEQDFHL